LSAEDGISIRLLVPSEAALLVALIRRCYGESYIDPSFYEQQAVRDRLESGRLSSIGAFTEEGDLVGHMGITLRSHGGITADAGMTLVDPDRRGEGIARRVAGGLAERALALGLVGVHDYPVTVHAATQRIGQGFGVDTGLMLANMPADVVFERMNAAPGQARTSSVIRWLPFGRSPERTVHLPTRYRAMIEALYAACYLRRDLADPRPGPSKSELSASYDSRRRTLKVQVLRVGSDLALRVASEMNAPGREGALIAHADISLRDPASAFATDALRQMGFFFAGLLPEYHDGDTLRMQWLDDTVEVATGGVIALESTRAIEAFVLEDRP
jgi:GNAT superfamily N-acetyltransferase